jgi:hypothetical protein
MQRQIKNPKRSWLKNILPLNNLCSQKKSSSHAKDSWLGTHETLKAVNIY